MSLNRAASFAFFKQSGFLKKTAHSNKKCNPMLCRRQRAELQHCDALWRNDFSDTWHFPLTTVTSQSHRRILRKPIIIRERIGISSGAVTFRKTRVSFKTLIGYARSLHRNRIPQSDHSAQRTVMQHLPVRRKGPLEEDESRMMRLARWCGLTDSGTHSNDRSVTRLWLYSCVTEERSPGDRRRDY